MQWKGEEEGAGLWAALFWYKGELLQASLGCSYPEGQAEMDRALAVGSITPSGLFQVSLEGPSLVTSCACDICP